MNRFLLPLVWNQLPEAIRNMLKNTRKKAKTWEEFRKAMTMMPLSDLSEEAAKIAKRDSFYAKITALHTCATGLMPSCQHSQDSTLAMCTADTHPKPATHAPECTAQHTTPQIRKPDTCTTHPNAEQAGAR